MYSHVQKWCADNQMCHFASAPLISQVECKKEHLDNNACVQHLNDFLSEHENLFEI